MSQGEKLCIGEKLCNKVKIRVEYLSVQTKEKNVPETWEFVHKTPHHLPTNLNTKTLKRKGQIHISQLKFFVNMKIDQPDPDSRIMVSKKFSFQ